MNKAIFSAVALVSLTVNADDFNNGLKEEINLTAAEINMILTNDQVQEAMIKIHEQGKSSVNQNWEQYFFTGIQVGFLRSSGYHSIQKSYDITYRKTGFIDRVVIEEKCNLTVKIGNSKDSDHKKFEVEGINELRCRSIKP